MSKSIEFIRSVSVNGGIRMKDITVWLKFDVNTQKWNHNHIKDGHVPINSNKPIGTPEQTKIWDKSTWIFQYKHIDENQKVIE